MYIIFVYFVYFVYFRILDLFMYYKKTYISYILDHVKKRIFNVFEGGGGTGKKLFNFFESKIKMKFKIKVFRRKIFHHKMKYKNTLFR